jgi:hypothetical protein
MSDVNNLLQEIDEELQHQKMIDFWKKYGVLILTLALVVVLATAGLNGWKSYRTQREQKTTSGLLAVMTNREASDTKKVDDLRAFADRYPTTAPAALARFELADMALSGNDKAKAVELYDALAADPSVEAGLRQLADLRSVQAQMDTGDPAALAGRLEKHFADGAFRFTAKEQAAYLLIKAGQKDRAKQILGEIAQDKDAPPSMIRRVQDMRRWVEGSAS